MRQKNEPAVEAAHEPTNERFGNHDLGVFDARSQALPIVDGHQQTFADAFSGKAADVIMGEDGLPRPDDAGTMGALLPLSYETFVCLEDDRTYVERFAEELSRDEARHLNRLNQFAGPGAADGAILTPVVHSRFTKEGEDLQRAEFKKEVVKRRFGMDVVSVAKSAGPAWIPVRPIRPRCQHYDEQMSVEQEFGKGTVPLYRFCQRFRTLAGAAWSVQDESIFACTAREPRDFISENRLVLRNREKMEQGANRTFVSIVDEQAPAVNWAAEAMKGTDDSYSWDVAASPNVPSTVRPAMVLMTPAVFFRTAKAGLTRPQAVLFCDDDYQPPEKVLTNAFTDAYPAPSTGEAILRMRIDEPPHENEDDAATWPAFKDALLPIAIPRNAAHLADALWRGRPIWIVSRDITKQAAFVAATVLQALVEKRAELSGEPVVGNALQRAVEVEQRLDRGDAVNNLSWRTYLRGMGRIVG